MKKFDNSFWLALGHPFWKQDKHVPVSTDLGIHPVTAKGWRDGREKRKFRAPFPLAIDLKCCPDQALWLDRCYSKLLPPLYDDKISSLEWSASIAVVSRGNQLCQKVCFVFVVRYKMLAVSQKGRCTILFCHRFDEGPQAFRVIKKRFSHFGGIVLFLILISALTSRLNYLSELLAIALPLFYSSSHFVFDFN